MAFGTMTLVAASKAPGPIRHDVISFAGPASYTTAGEAFDAAAAAVIGVKNYDVLAVVPVKTGGYMLQYDRASGKLQVFTGDYNPAADSPFVECDSAENLSAVTFEVMVISQ